MTDLNKFTATGRVTANAELKYTSSNTVYTTFCIAVNESYKKDGEWKDKANFFNCTIWGKYAESMHKHLMKGKQIAIEAKLNHTPWVDKDDNRHNDVVLNIQNIVLLSDPKNKIRNTADINPPEEEKPDSIPF